MFNKENFITENQEKAKDFPKKIGPEYSAAIFGGTIGVVLLIGMQQKWLFEDTVWFYKYGLVAMYFLGCFLTLRQYCFTEKRLQIKILGITINDMPKRDIMQIGVITYNFSRYLLIVLKTAPRYVPDQPGSYRRKYISKNNRDTFLIGYDQKYDAIIQTVYGEYDFYEERLGKK